MIERVPAGRMASPDEIAESVAFHASPAASYVTGQMIMCCGGRSMGRREVKRSRREAAARAVAARNVGKALVNSNESGRLTR